MLPVLPLVFAAPICTGTPGGVSGWACRREFGGHRVLDLHGTDSAIGQMYGSLLREELTAAYVPMVDSMLDELPEPFRAAF